MFYNRPFPLLQLLAASKLAKISQHGWKERLKTSRNELIMSLPLFNALSPPVSMDIRLLLFFLSKVVKQTWNGLGVKDLTEPKPIVESYAFKAFD